jgi:hypothetical protein
MVTTNPAAGNTGGPKRKIQVVTQTIGEATANEVKSFREQAKQSAATSAEPPAHHSLESIAKIFADAGQPFTVSEKHDPSAKKVPQPLKARAPVVSQPDPIEEKTETETAKSFDPRITSEIDQNLGEHAERLQLASNCIFYNFTDVTVRPFGLPDFTKIEKANRTKNETMIIDIVSGALDVDARDLTQKDFRNLMYHLRIVSFVRNPYRLSWTSIYGNVNVITLNKTTLKIKELNATREEYQEWVARGFCMPTMRDLEEYDGLEDSLDEDDKTRWIRAKYLVGNGFREKMARSHTLTPDEYYVDIKEFAQKFEDYGVIEYAEATDQHFNAEAALETLQGYLTTTEAMLQIYHGEEEQVEWNLKLIGLREEIARIASNPGEAAPKRETVEFSISLTDFFSVL